MKKFFILCLFLVGCEAIPSSLRSPTPIEQTAISSSIEAWNLQINLPNVNYFCSKRIHNVSIATLEEPEYVELCSGLCGPEGNCTKRSYACFDVIDGDYYFFIHASVGKATIPVFLHETLHACEQCALGDADGDHLNPEIWSDDGAWGVANFLFEGRN